MQQLWIYGKLPASTPELPASWRRCTELGAARKPPQRKVNSCGPLGACARRLLFCCAARAVNPCVLPVPDLSTGPGHLGLCHDPWPHSAMTPCICNQGSSSCLTLNDWGIMLLRSMGMYQHWSCKPSIGFANWFSPQLSLYVATVQ